MPSPSSTSIGNGFGGNLYYTSTDGITWTPQEFEGFWYHKAPYLGGE